MADADPTLGPVDFDPFEPVSARDVLLPLTEPQGEMWTAAAMSREANCSYNQCFAFTFHGPLRIESLHAALDEVVARHDALRAVVAADGGSQTVRPPFSVELPLVDLSALDPAARLHEFEGLLERECETPFDLAEGPLVRAFVVRESAESHRFVLTVHHIVCDGWSSSVLFSELGSLYAADLFGVPAQLSAAGSYQQYVAEQTGRDGVGSADEEFWVAQYPSGAPVLDLPLTGARPATKTYRSGREHLLIDEELYAAVRLAGAKSGATLFVSLLAAFEVLVYRLSGQSDFVVGIPFADQPKLENPALVAHCVNTVPLRARLDPAATFVEHLRTVRHALAEAQEHSQLTFGSLVRRLNVPRDRSRTPLVPITFTLDRIGAPFDFGDVTIGSLSTPKSYSNFELSVNVVDSGSNLVVECDYNEDLFDGPTLRGWLSHYETLLRAIVAQPDDVLDALPILNEEDRRKILVEWNDTSVAFPDEKRLDRLFEAQARRTPDADAVVNGTERLSYRDLDRRANQLAHRLRALGVQNESLVGICLERSLELVISFLAVLKAGGAYVPLDPDYPPARLAFMIEDSQSSLILTRGELAGRLPGNADLLCLDEEVGALAGQATTSPEPDGTPESLAYVIYTSGSTGRPNGVEIEHAAVVNHMLWLQADLPLEPSDRVLQRTPISFDASVCEVYPPLLAGACLVMAPSDPRRAVVELGNVIRDHGVTVLVLVPSYARVFLDEPGADECTSLRLVICGGEPLPVDLYRELRARLGARVLNFYGPTEATIDATWWPSVEHEDDGEAEARFGPRGWVPIGRPIANSRAYVLDARLEPVPVGTVGALYLAGDGLARGYRHREDLTAERFVHVSFGGQGDERAYRTGDLARYRHDGTLEFVGRVDHQVKIRGFRIELDEIEAALARQEEVADVVVMAREDSPGDTRLVAYVAARSDTSGLADRLKSSLRDDLPEYMVPAHVVFLAALPLTPNGKVDRKSLPAPTPEAATAGPGHAPPSTVTELTISTFWADALGIASPGVHDDFFDVGGHSLIAARIVSRLRAAFGVDVAMRHLFEQPTIAGLARTVDVLAVSATGAVPADGAEREEIEI